LFQESHQNYHPQNNTPFMSNLKLPFYPENKYKALIFDLDGTLVDSIKLHYKAWQNACAKYGISFDMNYMYNFTGKPTIECGRQIIRDFKLTVSPQQFVDEKESFFQQDFHKIGLVEPIASWAKYFYGKIPIGVGTGTGRNHAIQILTNTGLISIVDAVIAGDDVENAKPHPETFLRCAELLKTAPSDCLVFEDGEYGIQAAKAAGMDVIDVKPFYEKPIWD